MHLSRFPSVPARHTPGTRKAVTDRNCNVAALGGVTLLDGSTEPTGLHCAWEKQKDEEERAINRELHQQASPRLPRQPQPSRQLRWSQRPSSSKSLPRSKRPKS